MPSGPAGRKSLPGAGNKLPSACPSHRNRPLRTGRHPYGAGSGCATAAHRGDPRRRRADRERRRRRDGRVVRARGRPRVRRLARPDVPVRGTGGESACPASPGVGTSISRRRRRRRPRRPRRPITHDPGRASPRPGVPGERCQPAGPAAVHDCPRSLRPPLPPGEGHGRRVSSIRNRSRRDWRRKHEPARKTAADGKPVRLRPAKPECLEAGKPAGEEA